MIKTGVGVKSLRVRFPRLRIWIIGYPKPQ